MIQHLVYQCPKCLNTLLVSNKMLHDLRCTDENPATYENILFRQNQQISNNQNYPKSVQRFSNRMSIKNDDGTMTDIIKEKNMKGKEEFIELKYDPKGNIISRKKADSLGNSVPPKNFSDYGEYNGEEDEENFSTNYDNNNNTYYEMKKDVEVKKAPSIIYETAEAQEIVYEAPAKYDPHVTINKPIEETIINSQPGLSDGMMNDIIRNTITIPGNSNNNFDFQKSINMNGFNYSKINGKNSNSYNQKFDMDDFGNYNFSNQFKMGNNNKNYNSFQMNGQKANISRNGKNGLLRKNGELGNLNFYSYDYQF